MLGAAIWFAMLCAGCGDGYPVEPDDELGFESVLFATVAPPVHAQSLLLAPTAEGPASLWFLQPASPAGSLLELAGGDGMSIQGLELSPGGRYVVFSARTDRDDYFHLYLMDLDAATNGQACFLEGDLGPACSALSSGPGDDLDPFFLSPSTIGFFRQDAEEMMELSGRTAARVLMQAELDGSDRKQLSLLPGLIESAAVSAGGGLVELRRSWRESGFEWLLVEQGAEGDFRVSEADSQRLPSSLQSRQGILAALCRPESGTWAAGVPCALDEDGSVEALVEDIPFGQGCSPVGRVRDFRLLQNGMMVGSAAASQSGCVNADDEVDGRVPDFALWLFGEAFSRRQLLANRRDSSDAWVEPVRSRSAAQLLPFEQASSCNGDAVLVEGYVRDEQGRVIEEAARIRVYAALDGSDVPWRVELGGRAPEAICGAAGTYEAPVYPDGSFSLWAPSGVPLRLAVLDSYGAVLARHPLWLSGGSCRRMSCSGCHAGAVPVEMAGSEASRLPPTDLSDISSARVVDYRDTIQPLLVRSCATAGCHDSETAAGSYVSLSGSIVGLDLSSSVSGRATTGYNNLVRLDVVRNSTGSITDSRWVYVEPGWARGSRLVQKLGVACRFDCRDRSPYAGWGNGAGRRHPTDDLGAQGLDEQSIWQIVEWIDTGAMFVGPGDSP